MVTTSSARSLPLRNYVRRLVWLSLLPPLLLAALVAADSVRRLRASEDAAAQQRVEHAAQRIDAFLQFRVQALLVMAESPLLDEGRLADCWRRLKFDPLLRIVPTEN